MFIRHCCKIFLNANKHSQLLNFSAKPLLWTRTKVLPLTRPTAAVTSFTADLGDVLEGSGKQDKFYFSQYLLNNPDIYCVVNIDNINVKEKTNFHSLKLLKDFIDNPEETEVPGEVEHCLMKELSDYGLEEIYKFIILISNPKFTRLPVELIKHLGNELLSRKYSFEDMLKILFVINGTRSRLFYNNCSKFPYKYVIKLCSKMSRLSPQQAVQLMLTIRFLGPGNIVKFKYPMQEYFARTIPELNSNELGLIAYGFLRAEISFSHTQLPYIIINKATEEIENFHRVSFNYLCKLFTTNLLRKHGPALLDFQEKAVPLVAKLDLQNMITLAGTGSNIGYMNPLLLETLANHFKKNIDNCNIYQIQRMVKAMTAYNFKDDELFCMAIKVFESQNNGLEENKVLISFLYSLILHKLYPENLLGLILSNKFRSEVNFGDLPFFRMLEYYFINYCVELEKPTHNFELLDYETRKNNLKPFKFFSFPQTSIARYANLELWKSLSNIYGERSVFFTQCLPHFSLGSVMRFDKTLKAWAIPEDFTQSKPCYAKEAFKDDLFWLFIWVVGPEEFVMSIETPCLKLQTQIRQLEAIGYKPVLIQLKEFKKHIKAATETDFLEKEIIESLKEEMEEKSG